jgi:uncharacterized membrane protein
MITLALGLLLFLGAHSVRIVADDWRSRVIAARGPAVWKGLVTAASLLGFALIVVGYRHARLDQAMLWAPPVWTRHLAGLFVLVAFVLLLAAYVPGNAIKARLHHPMVLSVKTWAFAHLIANGGAADVLLFGAFLAWAVVDYASSRRRDRAANVVYSPGHTMPTVIAVVAGVILFGVFGLYLHPVLFGVAPFGALGH